MKAWLKRGLLILCIASLLLCIGSCICTYPKMTVGDNAVYDFFYDTSEDNRAEYLKNHEKELAYTQFGNAFILVNCRDITHETGEIRIYPCSYNLSDENIFTVNKVSLVTQSGEIIYRDDNVKKTVTRVTPTTLYSQGDSLIITYDIDNKWYFAGNKLNLCVEIEFEGEIKELTFVIKISRFWSFVHTV